MMENLRSNVPTTADEFSDDDQDDDEDIHDESLTFKSLKMKIIKTFLKTIGRSKSN